MKKQKFYLCVIFPAYLFCSHKSAFGQNEVMMQGFRFYVPVEIANRNGT
jgi:hypothetical protein